MPQTLEVSLVDYLRHAVKINQQTEKDLVRRRTVFVDAGQVAQDSNAGYILPVESEDARGLRAEIGRAVG